MPAQNKQRCCSICKQPGHNKTTCTQQPPLLSSAATTTTTPSLPVVNPPSNTQNNESISNTGVQVPAISVAQLIAASDTTPEGMMC